MAFCNKKHSLIGMISLALTLLLMVSQGVAGYEHDKLEILSPAALFSDNKKQDSLSSEEAERLPVPLHPEKDAVIVDGAAVAKNSSVSAPVSTIADSAPEHRSEQPDFSHGQIGQSTVMASYLLGSGDKIKVTVFGEPDLSSTYLVNEEGFISMPLIGEVDVKDKTIFSVKDMIVLRLQDGYLKHPSVAMEVAEFRPIYIMGEIRSPGRYNFVTDMTIRNAVAIAGGFTYRANERRITITRGKNGTEDVKIELGPDDKVHPGDIILVKERFF